MLHPLYRLTLAVLLTGLAGTATAEPADSISAERREAMVELQIEARGVKDPAVLAAMRAVPRHLFVPTSLTAQAYIDNPLPIGEGQTISQPYIVARMTELLQPQPGDTVLEIGTGSGYQAAVLAEIVAKVFTIEIVEPLAKRAETLLDSLGYGNVEVKAGDGYRGWPEHAPFSKIIVTAAPGEIPKPLLEQLAEHGRMVIPVGERWQDLLLVTKVDGRIKREKMADVLFVPMTGEAQERDSN